MAEIQLTKGKIAIVDGEDLGWLTHWKWHCVGGKYAARTEYISVDETRMVYMHRAIWEYHNGSIPNGVELDHSNCDKLDNCKCNLRLATDAESARNVRKQQGAASSLYKGVSWNKALGKWEAYIGSGETRRRLGLYLDEQEAARAYDAAAVLLYSDFANLNFNDVSRQEKERIKRILDCSKRKKHSGYKGVSWSKRQKKWVAYAFVGGRQKHLGCFENEDDAAFAVKQKGG